jgi:hypothetical protein
MWEKSYTQTFKGIQKEDIWQLWTDINNWSQWHDDLDYCKIEGPFAVGNHFMLKPKDTKAVKIELVEIDEGKSFTDCTTFFEAKMYDTHELEETDDGLKLTNTLVVTGFLRYLWIKLVAQNVHDTVPKELDALVKLARSRHG